MKKIIILGGGFAGLSAAYFLSKKYAVTIIERDKVLGGLAASFEINGTHIPLGYHHVLSKDKNLVDFLKILKVYDKIGWKSIKMSFWIGGKPYVMTDPKDFLMMPLSLSDKLHFARFMIRCIMKKNWDDMTYKNAHAWLDDWAGPNIRKKIFEPLVNIKFGLTSSDVSASWLGSRLAQREGSSRFGFLPGDDWTHLIVKTFEKAILHNHGRIMKRCSVQKILVENNKFIGVIANDKTIKGDIMISTLAPPVFKRVMPEYDDPVFKRIEYVSTISVIIGTKRKPNNTYWMVFLNPRLSFSGIFQLTELNNGISEETVLNMFTNTDENSRLFSMSDEQILDLYSKDFKKAFGYDLEISWYRIFRIKNSSPKFSNNYVNPSIKSRIGEIYFAGNYMTYPLVTSTGSAMLSGRKTAEEIMRIER